MEVISLRPLIKYSIFLVIINAGSVSAQNSSVEFMSYYGWYSMSDMKKIQSETLNSSTIPFKQTELISGYYGYEISYNHFIQKHIFGVYLGLSSTGGRLHYSDYSGHAYSNTIIRNKHLGVQYQNRIIASSLFQIFVGGRAGISKSNVELQSAIDLNNSIVQKDEHEFNSFDIHFGPLVGIRKPIKVLYLGLNVWYELNLSGKLYSSRNNEQYLIDPSNNDPLKADWSGARLAVCIGVNI